MALHTELVTDLIALEERGALGTLSRVVEIGAQQLSNRFLRETTTLDRLFGMFGRPRPDLGMPHDAGTDNGIERLPPDAPPSRVFWEALGASYCAIEYGGHRDAVALDLNRDRVPRRLRGCFDLVINTGTTEHVANQDNAFRVVHDLARPGGLMVHAVPGGGHLTHGFVNYTPKFFWHLCRENRYGVERLVVNSGGANPVPAEVVASNTNYGRGGYDPPQGPIENLTILAILRRPDDAPFVTPFDMPAGVASPAPSALRRLAAAIF